MSFVKKPQIDTTAYYGIKILRDGTWLHQDRPITRHNMVQLFSRALHKDEQGDYWLITPYEKGRIEVEDVPFTAVELDVVSAGRSQNLRFRANTDEWVVAGKQHPIRFSFNPQTQEPSPYILIRDNLEARMTRPVYYTLAGLAVQLNDTYGVWSDNMFFTIE